MTDKHLAIYIACMYISYYLSINMGPGLHGDPAGEALDRLRARRKERKLKSKYFAKTARQEVLFSDPEM